MLETTLFVRLTVAKLEAANVKSPEKWVAKNNTGLGGISPLQMIMEGKGPRLLHFVGAELTNSK